MTIEYRDGANGQRYTVTTECAFCGERIGAARSVARHIANHCEEAVV